MMFQSKAKEGVELFSTKEWKGGTKRCERAAGLDFERRRLWGSHRAYWRGYGPGILWIQENLLDKKGTRYVSLA
jgi:hypothetical protein